MPLNGFWEHDSILSWRYAVTWNHLKRAMTCLSVRSYYKSKLLWLALCAPDQALLVRLSCQANNWTQAPERRAKDCMSIMIICMDLDLHDASDSLTPLICFGVSTLHPFRHCSTFQWDGVQSQNAKFGNTSCNGYAQPMVVQNLINWMELPTTGSRTWPRSSQVTDKFDRDGKDGLRLCKRPHSLDKQPSKFSFHRPVLRKSPEWVSESKSAVSFLVSYFHIRLWHIK